MLAAQTVQTPNPPMLTDREWSASAGVPPGLDCLLWLEPTGVLVEFVLEDLDG